MTPRPAGIGGLVLAGGGSTRMGGGYKFLLELRGRPIIDHVMERLEPQVAALAVSANCDPARIPGSPLVLPDAPPSRGPLSGLLAGLAWASRRDMTHLATAAADTPFLPRDLVARLAAGIGDGAAALAASAGRLHPTFGLWSVELLPTLEDYLERDPVGRVAGFAAGRGARRVDFPADGYDPFFNVNEPRDLEEARRMAPGIAP